MLVYFCSFIHVNPDESPPSSPLSRSMGEASRSCACISRRGWGSRERYIKHLTNVISTSAISLKGSCVTCLLRELLLVCRGWACLSLACWHTILGLLQTNATESDTCPEHLVKITSLLPSLPRCLLPLLHSSPLHLPPRFIYFLPSLLHRNGHWVVLLVVHSCSPSANCMVWFSLHVW